MKTIEDPKSLVLRLPTPSTSLAPFLTRPHVLGVMALKSNLDAAENLVNL